MKHGRILQLVAGATLMAALAACGGGGDDDIPASTTDAGTPATTTTTPPTTTSTTTTTAPTAGVMDRYAGTWRICWPAGASSELETLTIAKTGDTTGTFSSTLTTHNGTGCAGAATATEGKTGTVTWTGTKTVGTETVDKIDLVMGTRLQRQIAVIRADGRFYSGIDVAEPGSNPDAAGYPGALQAVGYSKVS